MVVVGFLFPLMSLQNTLSVPTHPSLVSLVSLLGTQISCFPPINVSMRQAVYVDSFCWAAVQQQDGDLPLWLHKVPMFTQHALLTVVTVAILTEKKSPVVNDANIRIYYSVLILLSVLFKGIN